MKTQTHTPGDWIAQNGSNGQGLIYSETTGANVAVCYDQRDTALIGAAPEMLKALRTIQNDWDTGTDAKSRHAHVVRAAIARAEGNA